MVKETKLPEQKKATLADLDDQIHIKYQTVQMMHEKAFRAEGEISQADIDELFQAELEVKETAAEMSRKICAIMSYNEDRSLRIAEIKGREERLRELIKQSETERRGLENTSDWFEKLVRIKMENLGLEEVQHEGRHVKIKTRTCPISVNVWDVDRIPPEYLSKITVDLKSVLQSARSGLIDILNLTPDVIITPTADKKALKDRLEAELKRLTDGQDLKDQQTFSTGVDQMEGLPGASLQRNINKSVQLS